MITSSDAFAYPNIDPAILTNKYDIYAMVQGMKSSMDFLLAPAFRNYVVGPYGDLASAVANDTALAAFAASNAVTVNHPSGTCQMSCDNSSVGVVDSQLRVKGVSGLRVVDASVFVSILIPFQRHA